MNKSSLYGIKIDYEKSQGSYIYDKITKKKYLDFFGQYASLSLGYNHPIFKTIDFETEIKKIAHVKITNCETLSDEVIEFDNEFRKFTNINNYFKYFHYCCTGSLAVESAIKTALDYKNIKGEPYIISFKGSFHGINSYGGFITDRFKPVNSRLDGFPIKFSNNIENPIITYNNNISVNNLDLVKLKLNEIKKNIEENKNIVCILIEPIQSTYGDRYFPIEFFKGLRDIADKYDIPLIFDEIQVGFGTTGKIWYFQHLNIIPDIVIFGKKTQISGIMVKEKFGKIFQTPTRLEVTWNGNVIDMVRCKYIIRAYNKYKVLYNVNKMSKILKDKLLQIKYIKNLRNYGLLFAFDLESTTTRDKLVKYLYDNGIICNPTRDFSIRFRPNLLINENDTDYLLEVLNKFSL